MKLTTLEDIICPVCRAEQACESPLAVSELVSPTVVDRENVVELLEAVLICERCRSEYPIIAGVLVAVRDVATYLKRQFGSIVSNSMLCGGLSPQLLAYMRDKGYHLAKVECREYYDNPRKLSTYLCNHYDNITHLASEKNSFGYYLREQYRDFYTYALNLLTAAMPATEEDLRILDAGCYVGGVVNRLAPLATRAYGIDLSFAGILLARQIQLGYPERVTAYDVYLDGNIKQQRTLSTSLRENVDFVVASALNIPFRSGSFHLATNFNLLELMHSPRQMLRELRRVALPDAHLLVTSPYWWEEDEAASEEWIGGQEGRPTPTSVRSLLAELGVAIVAEQAEVPWILRYNSRAFMSFVNDIVIGKVVS